MSASDPMAEIRASFFVECEELLESLQDGLSALEDGSDDAETVNICFRAVHSIKGGAGAFGLTRLVDFAHRYENAMDRLRAGALTLDREAMLVFFRAADQLSDLVSAERDKDEVDQDRIGQILGELELISGSEFNEPAEEIEFEPTGIALDLNSAPTLPDLPDLDTLSDAALPQSGLPKFVIQFVPERELYSSGNEPLHLLRSLSELGTAVVECDISRLPGLDEFDAEESYLGWTITLETDRERLDIEEVFDFVEGLCTLEVSGGDWLPPPTITDTGRDNEEAGPLPAQPITELRLNTSAEPSRLTLGTAESASVPAKPAAAPPQTPVPKTDAPPANSGAPRIKATVRVELDRIERLVNLVGELVINQAMLSQSVAEAGIPPNSPVANGLEDFMQLTRDIQDSVMLIRAQPVKTLFQRMSRIVREASGLIGKSARLVTEGDATEVDKTVIERLADPLTHMIRNAVDHGLEDAETRQAAGKPEDGLITLKAAHRSGRVIIDVSDDGSGINRAKVKQIAEDKGLIEPGLELSEGEIDNLLFLPGFSTANEISDLSGRGVGMDVVRSAIQELGGRISISSTPGQGTTFSISLPLTLAVLDGMVIQVAGETLVVPLSAIVETLTLESKDIRTLGPETQVIHVRDEFVPLLDLGVELGYRSPLDCYDGSVVLLIGDGEGGSKSGLIVDGIEEQRQVVIKGLQDSYGRIPSIAAATILGDGQIALILEPTDLTAQATGRTRVSRPDLVLAG